MRSWHDHRSYAGEYFGFKFLKRRGPLIQIDVQGTVRYGCHDMVARRTATAPLTATLVPPLTRIADGAQPTTFKVLYILAYNQMRKRMSVIVEDDEGECWLYVKGADTVLYERLRESESKEESDNKLMTAKVRGARASHTLTCASSLAPALLLDAVAVRCLPATRCVLSSVPVRLGQRRPPHAGVRLPQAAT